MILSLTVTLCVLAYLLWSPATPPSTPDDGNSGPPDAVRVAGPGLIRIQPGTPLEKKIQVFNAKMERVSAPMLTVTGTVVASLRPGAHGSDYWQFNSPDILTAYTDWQKAIADVAFTETQLARVKELAITRIDSQKKVVERLTKLVDAGTDTPKDLATEQTTLLEYGIQGEKEIHEAESAVRVAKRAEAALVRQLQQAGLEPEMLQSANANMDIVMADVPEGVLSSVKIGQGCEAHFFGLIGKTFSGKVDSIAPVLSPERRSLRVLFVIHDPGDHLRPGMFAEIGLGTDARDAYLIPAEGVIHIGRLDYILVSDGDPGTWRITEIQVGEPQGDQIEVQNGLRDGTRVLGKGAILLKPIIVRALTLATTSTKSPMALGDR